MTDTSTTINISSIKDDVKKTLSLVGKRSVDRQSNTLFASVTLSSAEEGLIDSFLNEGIHIFFGEVAPVVFGSEDGEIITLAINASRVNETKLSLFQSNAEGFVKNFALKKAFEEFNKEKFNSMMNKGKQDDTFKNLKKSNGSADFKDKFIPLV